MSPLEKFDSILSSIEKEIDAHLKARTSLAKTVSQYILKSGGKKLRPLLFVLSARLCGCETGKEIKLCPIFEYLHVATLLHDDVIDGAKTRRGKPTSHEVWGKTVAILSGDFLLATALELAAASGNLRIVEVLSKTVSVMAQGEILEISKINDIHLGEEEYFEIIDGKTAALIAGACHLGGVLAEASDEQENALYAYGHNLGLAFQIVDDILDYIGSEKKFGKPVGQDIKEGKVTLPLIYALQNATPEEKDMVKSLFNKRQQKDTEAIVSFVKNKKGITLAQNKAETFISKAKSALSIFPPHYMKENLLRLADFIVKRNY